MICRIKRILSIRCWRTKLPTRNAMRARRLASSAPIEARVVDLAFWSGRGGVS